MSHHSPDKYRKYSNPDMPPSKEAAMAMSPQQIVALAIPDSQHRQSLGVCDAAPSSVITNYFEARYSYVFDALSMEFGSRCLPEARSIMHDALAEDIQRALLDSSTCQNMITFIDAVITAYIVNKRAARETFGRKRSFTAQ